VQAYVYDVTQGMAARMSVPLVGKLVEFVPHTGIVVFGKEYYFGSGPCEGPPGQIGIPTHQILDLGETHKTREDLEEYIRVTLAPEYTAENYNLCRHNCNHYADAVAKFLLNGQGIPTSIVNIADEALSTPQGQNLRVMIESMEKNMRESMGGQSALNPFGNAGGAPVSAAPAAPAVSSVAPKDGRNEELETAIVEIGSNTVEVQRLGLQTLMKMTQNVEKDPVEPKFRKIKMSNAVFTKKICECNGAVEAMLAIGWMPDVDPDGDDVWLLSDDAARKQAGPLKRFATELAKLPGAQAAAAPPAAQQGAVTAPSPDMGGNGGMGGMGGMPGGMGSIPGGLNPQMMQQMMSNPAAMQQAQQMMNNPQMMAQAQQMMQNPQMMAQMQQLMQDPQMMAQMQNMMGGR